MIYIYIHIYLYLCNLDNTDNLELQAISMQEWVIIECGTAWALSIWIPIPSCMSREPGSGVPAGLQGAAAVSNWKHTRKGYPQQHSGLAKNHWGSHPWSQVLQKMWVAPHRPQRLFDQSKHPHAMQDQSPTNRNNCFCTTPMADKSVPYKCPLWLAGYRHER